eukprot:scaffold168364_cov23-Tisochrysis_lutea.AAC.1
MDTNAHKHTHGLEEILQVQKVSEGQQCKGQEGDKDAAGQQLAQPMRRYYVRVLVCECRMSTSGTMSKRCDKRIHAGVAVRVNAAPDSAHDGGRQHRS